LFLPTDHFVGCSHPFGTVGKEDHFLLEGTSSYSVAMDDVPSPPPRQDATMMNPSQEPPPPRFYDFRVAEKGNHHNRQNYKLYLRPSTPLSAALAVLFRKHFSVVKGRTGAPLPLVATTVKVGALTPEVDAAALQAFLERVLSIKCGNTELVDMLGLTEATLGNLDSTSSPIFQDGVLVVLNAALPKKTVNPLAAMMSNAAVRTKFLPIEEVALPLLNDQVQGVILLHMMKNMATCTRVG
jgi:hypothetical protein